MTRTNNSLDPGQLTRYTDVCGWVLAGYLGKSDAFDQDDAMPTRRSKTTPP